MMIGVPWRGALVAILLILKDSPGIAFDVRSKAAFEVFAYPDGKQTADVSEAFFEVMTSGSASLSSDVSVRGEIALVADDAGFTDGFFDLRNTNRHRTPMQLVEAVLDYRVSDGIRLSAGRQIFDWSTFDELQPLSVLLSRSQSDIFRQRDLGLYSLSGHYEGKRYYLDVVVVPFAFGLSTQPDGRWNLIDDDAGKIRRDIDVPPVQFEETQCAVRAGAVIEDLDVALVGYFGRDSMPTFLPTLEFVGGVDRFELTVTDVYPKMHSIGASSSYAASDSLLLRLEGNYIASPEAFRDDFVQSAAGVEYSWGDFRLVASYFRTDITHRANQEVTDAGERSFFASMILGEFRFDDGGRWAPRLRGGYDTKEEVLLVQPEVSARVWQSLFMVISAEIIDGRKFGYFERIRHDDRIGLRSEWYF